MTSYGKELFMTFWGLMGVKNPKFSWFVVFRSFRCQKAWEYRCSETIHSLVNSPWILIRKTPIDCGGNKEYDDVIIFIGWLEFFSQFQIFNRRKSEFAATRIYAYHVYKDYWSLSRLIHFAYDNIYIRRDLKAQRLARRAEDREVPGSSPTQD